MIPIGATVDITTPPGASKPNRWRGVVTSHPGPYSIEIDGRLIAPANLAKVVGMITEDQEHALYEEIVAAVTERDALRELVAAQAMTNAELAQKVVEGGDTALQAKIEELQEWVANVQSYTEDVLLLFMGERRPARPIEPPELRRLAKFVFEGV